MSLPLLFTGTALAALFSASVAQAQPAPIKFGKIDERDLTAAPFAQDSAAAVVLCDYGVAHVDIVNGHLESVLERTTRIKILKKSGYEWATVEIPLIGTGQRLTFKGFTYNLTGGSVEQVKLENDGKFVEELVRDVRIRKFTLPKVREGSVLEYSYSITSMGSPELPDWQFQYGIPVRWSEFRASYPSMFDYKTILEGYLPLAVREQQENSNSWAYRWAMKDVPALRREPYITTMKDYLARLNLELASYVVPGVGGQNLTGTWEKSVVRRRH